MSSLVPQKSIPLSAPARQDLFSLPPKEMVKQASEIASVLKDVIVQKKLFKNISGKNHVFLEGWSTLGTLLGITAREVSCVELKDGSFEAVVELYNWNTDKVIGRASGFCGKDESTWRNRPRYAKRSMAVTRATSKAYRVNFSWIIVLAGYEPTPAEEMPEHPITAEVSYHKAPAPVNKGAQILNAFAKLGADASLVEDFVGFKVDDPTDDQIQNLKQIYVKFKESGLKPVDFFSLDDN